MKDFEYIYGPLYSWRLGVSLGIDPLSLKEKICNYDCVYCQLGKTSRLTCQRKEFVPTDKILHEIKSLPDLFIDYFTFSGRGEPTLAKNLGEMIAALRQIRKEKIAVITNSSLMGEKDVRRDLMLADYVSAKLDGFSQEDFEDVDGPATGIKFENILKGLLEFRREFQGTLALQIMFIERNKHSADQLARLARAIRPDEVQLNTPTRACGAPALSPVEMKEICHYFEGMNLNCVYDKTFQCVQPLNQFQTARRHGNFQKSFLKSLS